MRKYIITILLILATATAEQIGYKQIAKEAAIKTNEKFKGTENDPQRIIDDSKQMVEEQIKILNGEDKLMVKVTSEDVNQAIKKYSKDVKEGTFKPLGMKLTDVKNVIQEDIQEETEDEFFEVILTGTNMMIRYRNKEKSIDKITTMSTIVEK